MSYVIQIWKYPDGHPLPKTASEAVDCVSAIGEETRVCAQFRVLARNLTARYPCICSPEIEQVDEEKWAWSEGPLDGNTDTAVYAIGLNRDRVDEVMPFVIITALALGLNVLDEQCGRFFLAKTATPATDLRPPLPENEVRRLFLEALEAILAKYGFVPGHQTGRFEREFPGGFQRIIAPTWDFKPSYPFALMVEVQFACINDTAKRVFGANFAKPPGLFNMIGHLVYPQDRQKHSLPIRSISDMDAAMRVVAITVDTKIMPFLDRLNTVVEFERFINADTSTSERW
jgi:hypothetical protein